MKKISGIMLTIILIIGNCMMALAENDTSTINSKTPGSNVATKEVLGKYIRNADTVYSVNISWGDMVFKYVTSSEKKWNPKTHQYDDDANIESGTWASDVDGGNVVKITNHSNANINVSLLYKNTGVSSVTGSFSNESLSIETADGKNLGDSVLTKTSVLSLVGNPGSTWEGTTKLGDIVVSLN